MTHKCNKCGASWCVPIPLRTDCATKEKRRIFKCSKCGHQTSQRVRVAKPKDAKPI